MLGDLLCQLGIPVSLDVMELRDSLPNSIVDLSWQNLYPVDRVLEDLDRSKIVEEFFTVESSQNLVAPRLVLRWRPECRLGLLLILLEDSLPACISLLFSFNLHQLR